MIISVNFVTFGPRFWIFTHKLGITLHGRLLTKENFCLMLLKLQKGLMSNLKFNSSLKTSILLRAFFACSLDWQAHRRLHVWKKKITSGKMCWTVFSVLTWRTQSLSFFLVKLKTLTDVRKRDWRKETECVESEPVSQRWGTTGWDSNGSLKTWQTDTKSSF